MALLRDQPLVGIEHTAYFFFYVIIHVVPIHNHSTTIACPSHWQICLYITSSIPGIQLNSPTPQPIQEKKKFSKKENSQKNPISIGRQQQHIEQ